jgi:hypothetical protein
MMALSQHSPYDDNASRSDRVNAIPWSERAKREIKEFIAENPVFRVFVLDHPDKDSNYKLIYSSVKNAIGSFGLPVLLTSKRVMSLVPRYCDVELIAHRVSKNLNGTVNTTFTVNNEVDDAILTLYERVRIY